MKFKHLAVAAAVAAATSGAWADSFIVNASLADSTYAFAITHTQNGSFTDTFNFTDAPVLSDVSWVLSTISLKGLQNIDFYTATLAGQSLTISPNGVIEGGAGFLTSVPGPAFSLVLTGATTGVSSGKYASYAGTVNVTPVPEPETYALMLAGLGVMGFIAARRKVG